MSLDPKRVLRCKNITYNSHLDFRVFVDFGVLVVLTFVLFMLLDLVFGVFVDFGVFVVLTWLHCLCYLDTNPTCIRTNTNKNKDLVTTINEERMGQTRNKERA